MAAYKSTIIFDILENILKRKSDELYATHIASEFFGEASTYMLLRYLGMASRPDVRKIVLDNYLTLERMPIRFLYKFLLRTLPKQSSSFISYIR